MSASKAGLSALGMHPVLANILGISIGAVSGTGTSQTGAAAVYDNYTVATASGGQTAFILPNINAGQTRTVANTSGTNALVFPPVGGSINGLSANTSVTVPANKPCVFTCISVSTSGVSSYVANIGA